MSVLSKSFSFSHFAGLADRQLFQRRQRHNLTRGAISEQQKFTNKVVRNHRTRNSRWRVNRHDNGSHRRFRYFQIDLHLSSDFHTTGVDWSFSFAIDSVQSSLTCFFESSKDLILELIRHPKGPFIPCTLYIAIAQKYSSILLPCNLITNIKNSDYKNIFSFFL